MKSKFTVMCMMGITCIILGHQPLNSNLFLKADSLFHPLPNIQQQVAPQMMLDSIVNLHLDLQKESSLTQENYEMLLYQQKLIKIISQ